MLRDLYTIAMPESSSSLMQSPVKLATPPKSRLAALPYTPHRRLQQDQRRDIP